MKQETEIRRRVQIVREGKANAVLTVKSSLRSERPDHDSRHDPRRATPTPSPASTMNIIAAIVLTTQLTLSGHLHDGLAALEAKKYDAAIASLTKVVDDKEPGNAFRELALHFRAEAYRGKGDKAKALADWTALLKTKPNAQLREPALAGFKEVGGDPKQLLPADSPKAVWEKFVAAAQKADLDGALAVSTGLWRDLIRKETRGDGGRLQSQFGREVFIVGEERIGEEADEGKAWLGISNRQGGDSIVMELAIDPKTGGWVISSYQEKDRNRAPDPSITNRNKLNHIDRALQLWAADHDNQFPPDMVNLGSHSIADKDILLWTNPQKPDEKLPFEYCPGLSLLKNPLTAVLVAAPVAVDGQREVLLLNGSSRKMKEDEFLKTALAQKWAIAGAWNLTKDQQGEVRQLVKQIGHEDFKVRQTARAKLQAMGGGITPVLEEFRDAADPEIRATVRELLTGK